MILPQDPHWGSLEKTNQPSGPDHPCCAWMKKSLGILEILICSTDAIFSWKHINVPVHQTYCQKHVGVYLHMKLNFKLHIKEKILKTMKRIGIIKKPSNVLLRNSLITIYKSFVRPPLDYGDLIYDHPNN